MERILSLLVWLVGSGLIFFTPEFVTAQSAPKLVVGITVDQMRWDYLYRFQDRWHKDGGFRRLLKQGFTCENTFITATPAFTASGHAGIYTGSVPAIHGITGNNWWDSNKQGYSYCTSDYNVQTVGSKSDAGHMSPVNLLSTTICDELKLATNFRSKTIGIALKDRGGILAAGHSANAAYWYDEKTGDWITSSYYMNELPDWIRRFNSRAKVDSLYQSDWQTLYPAETYVQSVADRKAYEVRTFGTPSRHFPYNLKRYAGTNYDVITATPYGNTLTTEFAKAAISGEQLGKDSITDFLAISYSSTDYLGHSFGPNSMEIEDAYLRFDIELGELLTFLDVYVGKGEFLLFLTSDHGVAHVPGFLWENKIPQGLVNESDMNQKLNEALKQQFGVDEIVKNIINFQVILNIPLIEKNKKLNERIVSSFVISWLENQEGVSRVFRLDDVLQSNLPKSLMVSIANGYYPTRSGHIQIIYKPGYIEGFLRGGTTHGVFYSYDTHIPLIWYGWQIPNGKSVRKMEMVDIAPTLAALLQIQEPSGSVGIVIHELFENSNILLK